MINVLIADGHQLFGAALAALVRPEKDLRIVGAFDRGDRAAAALGDRQADVVVAAADLPGLDGCLLAQRLRVTAPSTKVLILTSRSGPAELRRVMSSGARGYLRKDVSAATFLDAVRRLAAGHQVFDPTVVADTIEVLARAQAPSARELSALRLVAAGMTNNEVAHTLELAPGTVRNYISSVISKVNARNRVDAVRIARELALI